jgi:Kelch motif
MTGTWKALTHQPTFNTSTMIQLTDGRVMVQEEGTAHWHALTPDATGSYLDGTWSMLADMSILRRYYASAILSDGRMLVIGGEQSGAGDDTNKGEIYDPVADVWTPMPSPPGWTQVGDACSCLLPDGRLIIGALLSGNCVIYDPPSNSWLPGATMAGRTNEETWILLGDDTIITAQTWKPFGSERYSMSSNVWKSAGALPEQVVDPVMNEIGPAMLTYDDRVIFLGAADVSGFGRTVIYTPPPIYTGAGTWAKGPDIPKIGGTTHVCNDCPASLLPNGKVLAACAPYVYNDWGSPISFIEFDPFTDQILQVPTPVNNAAKVYWSRFALLPTGEVLFSPSSNDVQCYIPDGAPQDPWRPVIEWVGRDPLAWPSTDYLLRGSQLNGLSQANIYGDDCSPATNYSLVRLGDESTGQVYYARTHGFGTRSIARHAAGSVRFSADHVPFGHYQLSVVANGISSLPVGFEHRSAHRAHHHDCHPHPCGHGCGCGDRHESGCACAQDVEVKCVERHELNAVERELDRLLRRVDRLTAQLPREEPNRDKKTPKPLDKDDAEEGKTARTSKPTRTRRKA